MLFLIVSSLFILSIFYNFYWKRRNLPPGPTPLPIIGNLGSFVGDPKLWKVFIKWRKQYGDVYTYWFGEQPVVAVNDYYTIIETFVKDGTAYEDRPRDPDFDEVFGDKVYGLNNGPRWREQRRYTIHVLRDFGLGKNLMQERILEEFSFFAKYVHQDIHNGLKEIDVTKHIDMAIGSIINNLMFGYRFDQDTANEFHYLKSLAARQIQLFGHPAIMLMKNNFKFFGKLPYFKNFYNEMKNNRDELFNFYWKHVQEHKEKIDFGSSAEPSDYCEAYLREIHKLEGQEGHYFSERQLVSVLSSLWMAGQETTSTTLAWAVVFFVLYPEAQAKIQEEIDRVVGSDRYVTIDDKPNLHYTNAVCQEIQRAGSITPQNVFHATTRDVTIKGYHVPKGTAIVPQISCVMNDEQIFPNPTEFRPERFLNSKGEFQKVDEMIPFSVGKRICLGESLARMEIYLFVANMCNQFKFSAIPGKAPTRDAKILGICVDSCVSFYVKNCIKTKFFLSIRFIPRLVLA